MLNGSTLTWLGDGQALPAVPGGTGTRGIVRPKYPRSIGSKWHYLSPVATSLAGPRHAGGVLGSQDRVGKVRGLRPALQEKGSGSVGFCASRGRRLDLISESRSPRLRSRGRKALCDQAGTVFVDLQLAILAYQADEAPREHEEGRASDSRG